MNPSNGAVQQAFTQDPLDRCPAIKYWEQHRGYAFAGFVCWFAYWCAVPFALSVACGYFMPSAEHAQILSMCLASFLQAAIVIVYATVFYPSYFTASPVLKPSSDITFANFFAGGIVFGWLWTNNLQNSHLRKRPEKGVSYIVAIILVSVLAFLQLVTLIMLIFVFAVAYL